MSQFNIIIFDENKIEKFSMENIVEYMKKYSYEKYLDLNDLVPFIYDLLEMNDDISCNCEIIYQNDQYIYQLFNIQKEQEDPEKYNNVASILTNSHSYGKAVIVCSKILENYTCGISNICYNNLENILYGKIIHTAVKINVNNDMELIDYQNDVMENYDANNYRWMELQILKHHLILFIQVNPENNNVNKFATRLVGTNMINGDVIVSYKSENNESLNLTIEKLKDLLKICYGEMTERKLTDDELKYDEIKINGLSIINNDDIVLKRRLLEYNYKCDYCNITMNKGKVCKGCFRMRYHNNDCQIKHWEYHKTNCGMYKDPLNKLLQNN